MQRARSPEVSLVGPPGLASIAMAKKAITGQTDQNNNENEVPSAGWCIMQRNAMQMQCRLRKGDRKVGLFTLNWRIEDSITMRLDALFLISDLGTSWDFLETESRAFWRVWPTSTLESTD